jgi:hypothetical protein
MSDVFTVGPGMESLLQVSVLYMKISDPTPGRTTGVPLPVGILYGNSVTRCELDPPSGFSLSPTVKNTLYYQRNTETQDGIGDRGTFGMMLAPDKDQDVLIYYERR